MINKKEITLIIGFFIFFVFILGLLLFSIFQKKTNTTVAPSPSTAYSFRESAYEKLTPGKTTEQEALKLFGNPKRTVTKNEKEYLFYKTRFNDSVEDVLVFENKSLLYALENFSGDFTKNPNTFKNKYGAPNEVLYDKDNEVLEWMVFSSSGVAIAVAPFENIIIKVVYFSKQAEESFNGFFLKELGLEKEKEIQQEEIIGP